MKTFIHCGACIALGLSLLTFSPARAQNYEIPWWSIGGGETSTGGDYLLISSLIPYGAQSLSGGNFTLEGGFIPGLPDVSGPPALCGDANLDKAVNTIDAVLVLRSSVGLEQLSAEARMNADTNKDTQINVTDAIKILRVTVGLDEACIL